MTRSHHSTERKCSPSHWSPHEGTWARLWAKAAVQGLPGEGGQDRPLEAQECRDLGGFTEAWTSGPKPTHGHSQVSQVWRTEHPGPCGLGQLSPEPVFLLGRRPNSWLSRPGRTLRDDLIQFLHLSHRDTAVQGGQDVAQGHTADSSPSWDDGQTPPMSSSAASPSQAHLRTPNAYLGVPGPQRKAGERTTAAGKTVRSTLAVSSVWPCPQ